MISHLADAFISKWLTNWD